MPLSGPYVGIGVPPVVSEAFAETSRRVRVVFSEPMVLGSGIADVATYTITADMGSDARTVESVTVEPATNPSYVLLHLDGDLTIGTDNYNVAVDTAVTDVAGNALDVAADDADFDGSHTPFEIDHCENAKDRLAQQFKDRPNITALVCAITDQTQAVDQALADVQEFRSLDTAYGATLDGFGDLLGYKRHGLDDAAYRIRLRARALLVASRGRGDELLSILTTLDNGFTASEGGAIELIESFPSAVLLRGTLVPAGDVDLGAEFSKAFLNKSKAAGVKIIHEFWETDVPLLLMREIGGPAAPAGQGMSELPSTLGGHMKEAVGSDG